MPTVHDLDVGAEIESKCTKCKLDLAHTVVSKVDGKIKKVQCLTCGGQHLYRIPKSAKKATKKKAKKTTRKTTKKLEPIDLSDTSIPAKPYATTESYKEAELLNHHKYGRGQVLGVRGDKIDVQFEGDQKVLIHGRRVS